MDKELEVPKLDYATASQQVRSPLPGRIATGITVAAGIVGIVSFIFELDAGGLISFALGAIGIIVSIVAVSRGASRTRLAWISLWLAILYWIGAFFVEAYLGNIG